MTWLKYRKSINVNCDYIDFAVNGSVSKQIILLCRITVCHTVRILFSLTMDIKRVLKFNFPRSP